MCIFFQLIMTSVKPNRHVYYVLYFLNVSMIFLETLSLLMVSAISFFIPILLYFI